MKSEVKKAVVLAAGLGTRFLPLSKVLPKEFWPLADKPAIQYIIEEVKNSGIKKIIFVKSSDRKGKEDILGKYFKDSPKLKRLLKKRGKRQLLKELQILEDILKKLSFSEIFQKKPLGDGHAVLQAKNAVGKEAAALLFADDIIDSKTPAILQLMKAFKRYRKPIVALYRLPRESLSSYGIVAVKKVKGRTYRIKGIVEKPPVKEAPSNLAIVGKYILTPEVFRYLQKRKGGRNGEIILAEALQDMIADGKEIYGYELEGKWLECGNKLAYLKSNLYLSLKNSQFRKELKKFLKKEKLI